MYIWCYVIFIFFFNLLTLWLASSVDDDTIAHCFVFVYIVHICEWWMVVKCDDFCWKWRDYYWAQFVHTTRWHLRQFIIMSELKIFTLTSFIAIANWCYFLNSVRNKLDKMKKQKHFNSNKISNDGHFATKGARIHSIIMIKQMTKWMEKKKMTWTPPPNIVIEKSLISITDYRLFD